MISRIFPTIFTFFWAHCDEWEWTTAAALTEEFIFYRFLHLLWGSISTVRRWQLLKRSHTKKKMFCQIFFFSHFQIWPKITFLTFKLKWIFWHKFPLWLLKKNLTKTTIGFCLFQQCKHIFFEQTIYSMYLYYYLFESQENPHFIILIKYSTRGCY